MNTEAHRWDQPFTVAPMRKPGPVWLRRMIAFHRSDTRRKWLVEHGILVFLVMTLTFFFGVTGLVAALVAFIVRDLAMALLIETCVAVIVRKARI